MSRCVTVKAVFQAANSPFLLQFVKLPTRIQPRTNAGLLPVFVTKCVAVRGCFPVALPVPSCYHVIFPILPRALPEMLETVVSGEGAQSPQVGGTIWGTLPEIPAPISEEASNRLARVTSNVRNRSSNRISNLGRTPAVSTTFASYPFLRPV